MGKAIAIYSLHGLTPAEKLKFLHQLYGYTDRSNSGKYIYRREGILKEGEYERPIRGVVIFNDNKIKQVEKFMQLYGIEFSIYRIKD